MKGKRAKDGPKRYSSAIALADAWRDGQITGESFSSVTNSTGYMVTADPETIWNGRRSQVLALRNRPLGLVLVLRETAASLGKVALNVLIHVVAVPAKKGMRRLAEGIFENVDTPATTPEPYVKLDSLADPGLATCRIEELRPLVLASSLRQLELQLWRAKRYGPRKLAEVDAAWKRETAILEVVGLSVPEDILGKYSVLVATWRLAGK